MKVTILSRFGAAGRVAWGLWLVTAVLGVWLSATLGEEPGQETGEETASFVAYSTFLLSTATVGALVAARRSRNPIGWLLLGAGLSYVVGGITVKVSEGGGQGGLETFAAWLGIWVWVAGLGPLATFGLLLFPDGRLPSPRWRPVAWLAGAGLALLIAGLALAPGSIEDRTIDNPLGLAAARWLPDLLAAVGALALIGGMLGGIASLRARFRTASAEARQQLKWLVYAGALVATGVALSLTVEIASASSAAELSNAIVTLSLAAVPIAMGMAILRHRLYDVDVVINRTLVYGALTATLGAGYLGTVLLAQLVIGAESGLAVAISTLAVAALFGPARSRIQAAVDRRFYRRRYNAARTLEAFGARLRDEVELDLVAADLRAVAHDTVQPTHVSLWLRP
jgi:hypothetical protein